MKQGGGEAGSFWNISEEVIGACIEVHRHLGPGLLESVYERCLCHELALRNIRFERQIALPVRYKEMSLDCGYRLDLVVETTVLIELKSVERLLPLHQAQLLTYLKLTGLQVGLLINFNVPVLKEGLRRMRLKSKDPLPNSPPPCSTS